MNHQTRSQADLYVQHIGDGDDFLIEVKRDSQIENGEEVKRQLDKYHRDIEQRHDLDHGMTFLCIIGEENPIDDTESNDSDAAVDLSNFMDIPSTLDDIESEIDDLEVVLNTHPPA